MALLDLLDTDLNDIPSLPDFVNPPTGFYSVKVVDIKTNDEEGKAHIQFNLSINGAYELASASAVVPAVGSMFTARFRANDVDQIAWLKKAVAPLSAEWQIAKLSEVLEKMQGLDLNCKVKTTSKPSTTEGADPVVFVNVEAFSVPA